MYKISSILFSVFSILFLVLIIWYVSLGTSDVSWEGKIQTILHTWNHINSPSTIWRIEAIVVVGIAWVSFNLSSLTKWWNLVGIGHLLMLTEYIFMLGGYREVKSEETFRILNEMATWIFITSNLIWIIGMVGVYSTERELIKIIGVVLSGLSALLIGFLFFDIYSQKELMTIAMPVVLALYLYNTFYGIHLYRNKIL